MRRQFTILLCLIGFIASSAQNKEIKTQSVEINNFISYVVANYQTNDSVDKQLTFLIQTADDNVRGENLIMLQQGFKLLFERLSPNSNISLVTYEKYGGLALAPTTPNEDKLILHTLTDLKGNISEFFNDGIALGYQHAEQHFNENAENTVVMIRIANKAANEVVDVEKADKKAKKKEKTKVLLATAIALLPELIDVIKN
ncbi:MAG: hypothetical protein ACWA5P_11510 [bacterium]